MNGNGANRDAWWRDANPTEEAAWWLDELLHRNDYTRGGVVDALYLGRRVVVATVRRPVVIEGRWEDVERTADLFDLMDAHAAERGG